MFCFLGHPLVNHYPKLKEQMKIKGDRNEEKLLACLLFLFPFVAFAGHAQAETIKVVFDTAYAPFEFKDSDQTYKGIDVEILDKVAEINGWDLDKSFPGFDEAVNAVQAGQADAIMAGMTKTTEREKSSPCLILTTIQKLSSRLRKQ